MANSADPNEAALSEPSHQDHYCSQMYMYWSLGRKGLLEWSELDNTAAYEESQ